MTIEQQYTSSELSKRLKDVGFVKKSPYIWWVLIIKEANLIMKRFVNIHEYILWNKEEVGQYYSYDLIWDLCIRYKDEVWGDGRHCHYCGGDITSEVLSLLQQGKNEEAEQYILDHSILFNKK